MKLTALAPGKVNLSLFLGPGREDGRHELVTLLESVSLADELTLESDRARDPEGDREGNRDGDPEGDRAGERDGERDRVVCPGVEGRNLVSDALAGLRARGWDAPPVAVEIVKRIPVAAGMGGGSADAAAALRMACELAPGRPEEIASLAASLGADVPSQLAPGVSLGTGAGDLVEPFEPLAEHAFAIVPPALALPTAEVYREADRLGLPRTASELSSRYAALVAALRPGAPLPRDLIVNDLQPAALSLCPSIADVLEEVAAVGAEQALVCGSGPTVAGLWWGPGAEERAAGAADLLAPRFPGAVCVVPVGAEFGLPRFA